MKRIITILLIGIFITSLIGGCNANDNVDSGKLKVITTTTMLADLTRELGGGQLEVKGLMGPGIDPHLYKASAGDVTLMHEADMVVFNGLHLEGKMGEILENLTSSGKQIVKISDGLPSEKLLGIPTDPNLHDPHIWFDISLWKDAAIVVRDGLIELDPENKEIYTTNYDAYIIKLNDLEVYVKDRLEEIPKDKRVLVTAHDAFEYFGHAYGFDVKGLQGISTASEAGTGDIRELADFITDHEIKAVFVESSVPRKNIEALQEAVAAKGFDVEIGGELYSDSLGSPGSDAETYIGTFKENVDTIVNALK